MDLITSLILSLGHHYSGAVLGPAFAKRWNIGKSLLEKEKRRISTTKRCDTRTGFVLTRTTDLRGRNEVRFAHAIWSPFIIEPIMHQHG